MSDFAASLKNILGQSAKFVGKTASSAAKNTKYKMNELSALSKRRELISELGEKVYELAKQGTQLPAEVSEMVAQLKALENEINGLRADHAAQKAAAAEKAAAEKAARAAEKAAAKAAATIEKSTAPVASEMPENVSEVFPDADAPTVAAEAIPTLEVQDEDSAAENDADTNVPTLNV